MARTLLVSPVSETCGECYTKNAADGSWLEAVPCALHVAGAKPGPVLKKYRVSWTEEYRNDFMAENAQQAMEDRTEDNSFVECSALEAELVCTVCDGEGLTRKPYDKTATNCETCEGRGTVEGS